MNLRALLEARAHARKPLRVALVGAGKFGSMYLAQAKHTPGIHVTAIADLAPDRAKASLARVGWPAEKVAVRSIADGHLVGEVVEFAKSHYRQEAIYIRYLGVAEII